MEGQLRRWSPASDGQVWQDKFPEPLEAQFGRNLPPALTFRHFRPRENETVERLRWREPKAAFSRPFGRIRLAGKPATSRSCSATPRRPGTGPGRPLRSSSGAIPNSPTLRTFSSQAPARFSTGSRPGQNCRPRATVAGGFDALTDRVDTADAVKFAGYVGMPSDFGSYVGFAPVEEE